MNRAFLFEKIMTASEQLDREPPPPAPPQTLEGFVKEAGYALRPCAPDDIGVTWLERFGGTPLFESAKALAQQAMQRQAEEASREAKLQDFKKQIGMQDWEARRAAEEQIALQKSMLELELADLRNQEQMAAMQATPAGGTPAPTLGELAAEPAAAPKTASDKLAGPLDAIKGLNWSGLQRSAGNIARSSIAPAAVGAGLGAIGGAVTAGPGESALGGAAKGALGGAAIGGIGHAAARSGQALGVGKLLKGGTAAVPKTQAMSAAKGPATVAAAPAHAANTMALGPTQLSPQMPSPASAGPAALRAGGTPPSIPSLQTPARGTPPSIPSLQVPVKGGATLPPGADGKLPTIYNPYVS